MMRLRTLTCVCIASTLIAAACTDIGSEGPMPISTDSELALEFYQTGMKAYEAYRFNIAVENLQKAVKEDPGFFMANFWLYFMPGLDFKEIVENVMKSGETLNAAEQQIKSAFKYLVNDQSDKAIEHFKAAIALYPEDPELYKILYIYQVWYLKDFNNAIKSMRRVLELKEDDGFTYNWLGYAYMDIGDYKEAEKVLDHYIQLEPELANPYDSKGDYFLRTEQYEEAYQSFMKAYELDPYSFRWSKDKALKASKMQSESQDQE